MRSLAKKTLSQTPPIRAVAAALLLLLAGCSRSRRAVELDASVPLALLARSQASGFDASAMAGSPEHLAQNWDPKSGRGDVIHSLAGGDVLRTCFHCDYPGYTGGLLIGNYGGLGLGYYPRQPIRGFQSINVFCAQDESIWDRDEQKEYTYGWSENFGTGPDGARLEYSKGRVIERGPDRVVLESENAGRCYRVRKVAMTRKDARFWVIATRITNRCERPVHFDFFTGDDPWIGTYHSAEGDVGWTTDGIVRREKLFKRGEFSAGGLYDLGNRESGEQELGYSGQANFILLDPGLPLPDLAAFANSFAHDERDIDPKHVLVSTKMIALNLGWRERVLLPKEGFTVAFAMGLANPGQVRTPGYPAMPELPEVTDDDWSSWRKYLAEGRVEQPTDDIAFVSERVQMEVSAHELHVLGQYRLLNHGRGSTGFQINFPILVNASHPAPREVLVDGHAVPIIQSSPGTVEAQFPMSIGPNGFKRFVVDYVQSHTDRKAAYVVTSANRWAEPLVHASFVVSYPRSLGKVSLSYPPDRVTAQGDRVEALVVRQPFVPDREFEMRW